MFTGEEMALRWAPPSAGEARRQLIDSLQRKDISAMAIADAAVVLTEFVGNALRHARPMKSGELHVAWWVSADTIRIEVSDGGSDRVPQAKPLGEDSLGGRGLAMVDALSEQWGSNVRDGVVTVWAELRFRAAERLERVALQRA